MYITLLAAVGAILSPSAQAQQIGLRGVISSFVTQVDQASAAISDAMASFTAEYSSSAAAVGDREFNFVTSGTDLSRTQNPLASIKYGFVDTYSEFFDAAGADNTGMYVIEAKFKTASQMPDIHPALAGKVVQFVAYGPGPLNSTIYTTGSTSGSAYLSDYDTMSRIGGFTCLLKSARCTATDGSNPTKTCTSGSEETINGGLAPGMINNSSNTINLFYYVQGPLALCADQYAMRNSMGA
jgi:hypothetical protein